MNTQLQIFNFEMNEIRVVMIDGEPWWVAPDVCKILDIANVTQALERLDDNERSMFNIGRQGEVNVINESGLYSLVLGSRKSEAKEFKRWITQTVIPSIRKHGFYATQDAIEEMLNDPDRMIAIFQEIKT